MTIDLVKRYAERETRLSCLLSLYEIYLDTDKKERDKDFFIKQAGVLIEEYKEIREKESVEEKEDV